MGDEVTRRTQQALVAGIEQRRASCSTAASSARRRSNDFLHGVPAIVEALQKRQIECRVYAKEKFHAKAYITHSQAPQWSAPPLSSAQATSPSPGLTTNIELNVQLRREVELLQEWYERHWDEAEDITPEILQVIERHTREYTPFEVYAKALQQFFRGHELTVGGVGDRRSPRSTPSSTSIRRRATRRS